MKYMTYIRLLILFRKTKNLLIWCKFNGNLIMSNNDEFIISRMYKCINRLDKRISEIFTIKSRLIKKDPASIDVISSCCDNVNYELQLAIKATNDVIINHHGIPLNRKQVEL